MLEFCPCENWKSSSESGSNSLFLVKLLVEQTTSGNHAGTNDARFALQFRGDDPGVFVDQVQRVLSDRTTYG